MRSAGPAQSTVGSNAGSPRNATRQSQRSILRALRCWLVRVLRKASATSNPYHLTYFDGGLYLAAYSRAVNRALRARL
jgi:hypothetical protein